MWKGTFEEILLTSYPRHPYLQIARRISMIADDRGRNGFGGVAHDGVGGGRELVGDRFFRDRERLAEEIGLADATPDRVESADGEREGDDAGAAHMDAGIGENN